MRRSALAFALIAAFLALADYARGISVDIAGIERALGGVDPSQPEAMAELMSSGVFEPPLCGERRHAVLPHPCQRESVCRDYYKVTIRQANGCWVG